jgi:hypothetical protein
MGVVCFHPAGVPTSIQAGAETASWWLGRVQKIRRVGTKWGICRNPIDLLNRTMSTSKKVGTTSNVMILLNWFSKVPGHLKFKYDVTDSQWIDLDAVISTVTMELNTRTNIYTLDSDDASNLEVLFYISVGRKAIQYRGNF